MSEEAISAGEGILGQITYNKIGYARITSIKEMTDMWNEIYNGGVDPLKIKTKIMDDKIKLEVEYTKKSPSYGHDRTYRIKDDLGDTTFRLDAIAYPECCGVVILKNASINDVAPNVFRRWMNLIIADLNANDRYSKVLFYTSQDARMANLMATYPECIVLDKFKNRRSGNMLVGFEINLFDIAKKDHHWLLDSIDEDEDDVSMFEEEDTEYEEEDNAVPVLSYPDPQPRSIFNGANFVPTPRVLPWDNNDDLIESGDSK